MSPRWGETAPLPLGTRPQKGRAVRILLRLASAFSVLLLAAAAQGGVLYAAVNNNRPLSAATDSNLVTIDPATGAILSTIGATGFVISDLAVDPTTGVLYASTARAATTNARSLIRIDKTTGAGTLIGPFLVGDQTMAGLAFDASGTLYGWASRRTGPASFYDANLHTVDLVTGAATLVGDWNPADPETRGNGIAFDASGTLFWSGRTWTTNELNTVDPTTGLVTGSLPLTDSFFFSQPLASLSFDDNGTLFGLKDFGNYVQPDLITIDTSTGAVAVLGLLPLYVNGFAFDVCDAPVCLSPSLALNPPGTSHTLVATVIDESDEPVPGELVSFDVIAGPNLGDSGSELTDASGNASFTYVGDGGKGAERIVASTETDVSAESLKFWDDDCNDNNTPDTCDIDCNGFSNECSVFFCGTSPDTNADGVPDECVVVGLDIRPGAPSDIIDPNVPGKIDVAIMGSNDFDVADVDVSTLAFGPAAAPVFLWGGVRVDDLDSDDFDDLLVYFRLERSGIVDGDGEACVTGERLDGTPFSGCDDITAMGCGLGFELALLLPPLAWLRARRRRARARWSAVA